MQPFFGRNAPKSTPFWITTSYSALLQFMKVPPNRHHRVQNGVVSKTHFLTFLVILMKTCNVTFCSRLKKTWCETFVNLLQPTFERISK